MFVAVLDASPSPVDSKFEENCDFNPLTPVYHEIVDSSFVNGEGECAAKCAVSCSGTELCQFYKYDSCSKSCTLGNFQQQGTETPLEFDSDKLPLSTIKIRTSSPSILGTSLFTTTGLTFCTGASSAQTITATFSETFSTAPSAGASCYIFLYKPSSLKGKVKLTLGSTFAVSIKNSLNGTQNYKCIASTLQTGTVDVVVGHKATNGVRICEKTTAADTCEWYDGLVTVKWTGSVGTPAGSLQFTYTA